MSKTKKKIDIDLIVDPRPLTQKEKDMISNFIKDDKEKRAKAGNSSLVSRRKKQDTLS